MPLLVFPLCEAVVYHVRPTDQPAVSSSCPHPCLTLSEYYTNGYFQSHTIFKILTGVHILDRPLILYDLRNITLEAGAVSDDRPLITFDEPIQCTWLFLTFREDFLDASRCSSIFISNSNNITIQGIQVQSSISLEFDDKDVIWVTTGEISFENNTNVLVRDVAATRGIVSYSSNEITIIDSTFGRVNNFQSQCGQCPNTSTDARYGVFMSLTRNFVSQNTTVINAIYHGIYLSKTTNVQLSAATSLHTRYGSAISVNNAWYTRIENNPLLRICSNTFFPTLHVAASMDTVIDGVMLTEGSSIMFVTDSINVLFVYLNMANLNGESSKVRVSTSTNVTFQNCSFTDFKTPIDIYTDVVSLPSIVSVSFSFRVVFENCVFARNYITGISTRASDIIFSENVVFAGNTAPSGAAIIIAKMSNITLLENSTTVFLDNHAVSTGGAIHIITGEDALEQTFDRWCFLHVEGDRGQPRLTFRGNSAGKAGDVLYGGRLAIGFNNIASNCLQNFWNASDISRQSGLSIVSSEASRVCLCNTSSGIPDCLKLTDAKRHFIYPGQTISASVVTVGQAFGSVTGSVFAQFIQLSTNATTPLLGDSQHTQAVGKDKCNVLNYTIFQSFDGPTDAILALTPQFKEISYFLIHESKLVHDSLLKYRLWADMRRPNSPFPKNILEFPVYINVTILPCPLGFELEGDHLTKCGCSKLLQGLEGVSCDITDQTITRSDLVWIGVDNSSVETLVTSEYCPYNYCKSEREQIRLGDYNSQCNYNHSGMLCGECRAGFSLALGSSQCLRCSNWYLVLILPFALAGIALVAFIKVINLTIAHGTLNGLIFYVNIVKANEFLFLPQKSTNPLTIFIAWTNLDLGIETCFWDGLSAYSKTWLQFAFPLYIWTIALGIVILSKYSRRVAGLMGNNSVTVLATLFLLSYAKLLRTIIIGLSYSVIESEDGRKYVWSADGSLEYLGIYHAPLFAACVATLVFLWLPYTIILFCGQWLHKSKCRLVVKLLSKMKPFLDTHYGPLKGHHRYWFGAQLLIRATILLISSTVPGNSFDTVVFIIALSSVLLTGFSFLGFYQNKLVSIFELSFFVNLATLGLSAFFAASKGETNQTNATYVHIAVAFTQFTGLVIYQLLVQLKAKTSFLSHFGRLCRDRGFHVMEEDNWEMYETAALEREREASKNTIHDDSRVSVEITMSDSHPTY